MKTPHRAPFLAWLIEFSKKVVVLCVVLYAVVVLYSATAMWAAGDLSALSTLISESSEVLRACVFGYMVKAGVENWQKIKRSSGCKSDDESEE